MLRRRTYRRAAGLFIAVLALTPGVASAAAWLTPAPVNLSTDVTPAVAMDGVGNTITAWGNTGTTPNSIQGAHRAAGAPPAFSALPDFSAGLVHDSSAPIVVLNRAGNGFVAWAHTTATPTVQEIEISNIKSDGTVSAPVPIATTSTDSGLSGAINENGDAVIAWLMGGNTVQVTTRSGLAGTFQAEFDLAGAADGAPSAAIDSSGNAIVAWPQNVVHNQIADLKHAAGAANTTWTAAGGAITAPGDDLTVPVLAANPTGQIVVAFLDSTAGTVGAVSGTVSGGWPGSPTISTLSGTGVTHGPAVAMLDKGGAAVGWSTNTAVQMSLRPPPPGAFPPPAQVKSVTTSMPESFTLGSDGQGEIIAAWYGFNTTSMTNVVSASVKPQASPTFGAPQIISNPSVFSNPPVLSFDQTGDAVAAFQLGNGLPSQGVAAAFYDATPPTVGALSGPSTGTTGTPVTFSIPQPTDNFVASPSIAWNLGDGSPAASGPQVTHTYSAPGAYTVTVTVTDNAGNATTQTKVLTITKATTPPPPPPPKKCVVPKLKGQTLSQASAALRKANCALGKVTKPKRPKHRKLRTLIVSRSNPGAGSSRTAGTKVALTLVEKPKPQPKHRKHK